MVSYPRTTENRLLGALPVEDIEAHFADLRSVQLEQKQVLCTFGEPIEFVYFMEHGVASIVTTMATGATVEVGMIGHEGMVGVSAVLVPGVSAQDVVTQLPGSALRMSAARCRAVFQECDGFRTRVLSFVESLMTFSGQTAACNRLHSVEQRCARWLLLASDRIESNVLPITQEYLATMLGVRRSGVTQVAGELQRSGLIRYRHGRVTIVDRDGLSDSACECYRLDRERFDRLL